MSATTKRWMKQELQQLVVQRHQYQAATKVAVTPTQRRRRTQRLAAIDEEILGRSEALAGLARHERDEVVVPRRSTTSAAPTRREKRSPTTRMGRLPPGRRQPTAALRPLATQRAPKIGQTLSLMATPQSDPKSAVARVVGSAFTVGFLLTAVTMWSAGIGQPTPGPARAQRPAASSPETMTPKRPRFDDRVLAGTARPARR
jgi:hypothetical protein